MIDLTGDFLLTYLVREIKDVVLKHPRFREAGGETMVQSSVGVQFNDVRAVVSSIRSEGTRLSPDYFMYNKWGYSVLGKLGDKEGMFIEWVHELAQPDPAVYYLYVNKVDEQSRDVELIIRKFRWASGKIQAAEGSYVYLAPGIVATPSLLGISEDSFTATNDGFILLKYVESLNPDLTPGVDYWVLKQQDELLTTTLGGRERIALPAGIETYHLYEKESNYLLRPGIDFYAIEPGYIILSDFSPEGSDIWISYEGKSATPLVHPENIIGLGLSGTEALVPESIWIKTSEGMDAAGWSLRGDGNYYLNNLLHPGYKLRWDVKIDAGDSRSVASKMSTSTEIIPNLVIALGDKVFAGDEMAIMISPERNQTYEVFGSTENISFTIKVTANDRDTVNDLAFMIKEHLLVRSRDRHEAVGLTIYEASMDTITEARDSSGVQSTSTKEITITAASNWRYYVPLISQVGDVDISAVVASVDFPGASWLPYADALGQRSWDKR